MRKRPTHLTNPGSPIRTPRRSHTTASAVDTEPLQEQWGAGSRTTWAGADDHRPSDTAMRVRSPGPGRDSDLDHRTSSRLHLIIHRTSTQLVGLQFSDQSSPWRTSDVTARAQGQAPPEPQGMRRGCTPRNPRRRGWRCRSGPPVVRGRRSSGPELPSPPRSGGHVCSDDRGPHGDGGGCLSDPAPWKGLNAA